MKFNQKFFERTGVLNITVSDYLKEAQEKFSQLLVDNIENGFNYINPNVITIIVSEERFAEFLRENPDFHNDGDTTEFNWSLLNVDETQFDITVYHVENEFFLLCA